MKTPDPKPLPPRVIVWKNIGGFRAYQKDKGRIMDQGDGEQEYLSLAEHTALIKAVVEERDSLRDILRRVYPYAETNGALPGTVQKEARAALLRDGER